MCASANSRDVFKTGRIISMAVVSQEKKFECKQCDIVNSTHYSPIILHGFVLLISIQITKTTTIIHLRKPQSSDLTVDFESRTTIKPKIKIDIVNSSYRMAAMLDSSSNTIMKYGRVDKNENKHCIVSREFCRTRK